MLNVQLSIKRTDAAESEQRAAYENKNTGVNSM